MDDDILQSTLDDLSHLIIPPEQLTLENDAELGVGGYGEVFLAILGASDSQTKVAVKQLRIVQAKGVRRRVAIRLARELKVWATAKHPNILELLGFYLSDNYGCAQLVSAYMANGNVKEYIIKLQPNLATRLRFVQGITSGISYLHNCNPAICHGDVKPTNVLVNENLDVVLCDFGLATFILESGVSSGLTTSKSPKGSIRYMGPELLLEDEAKHTPKSDVWAWACTTFEVLTDFQPFHDVKGDVVVMAAIVQGRAPGSVNLLNSLASGGHINDRLILNSLKSIIPDCWIMDSAKRPPSFEILNRLISPDGIEALDIATASSHLLATEDRQPEPFPPPGTGLPMHADVRQKRKGSPGLEGRPEKRARGRDATIETEAVHMQKGYGEGAILMEGHTSWVTNKGGWVLPEGSRRHERRVLPPLVRRGHKPSKLSTLVASADGEEMQHEGGTSEASPNLLGFSAGTTTESDLPRSRPITPVEEVSAPPPAPASPPAPAPAPAPPSEPVEQESEYGHQKKTRSSNRRFAKAKAIDKSVKVRPESDSVANSVREGSAGAEQSEASQKLSIPGLFEGGTLVWAKQATFPYFPAVVFEGGDVDEIPRNVLADKDVCAEQAREDGPMTLVRFYDTTSSWGWIPPSKIKMLGEDRDVDHSMLTDQRFRTASMKNSCRRAYNQAMAEIEQPEDLA